MAKYLPFSTWLSRHIHSAPFPSLLCSAQKRRELARSVRQGAKATTKSFSSLPEVTKVQQPGKNGFCIFKTSGPTFGESHAHQVRDRRKKGKKKRKNAVKLSLCFTMIWRKEPSELDERSLQTSLSWCSIFITFFPHSHAGVLIACNSD